MFLVSDKYGNGTTNPYPNVTITCRRRRHGRLDLGRRRPTDVNQRAHRLHQLDRHRERLGARFRALTSRSPWWATVRPSTRIRPAFNIGAPPVPFTPGNLAVFQVDTAANNTTFSIIEVNPATASQAAPVNIVPISATGTNALRESSAGSTGRLALSDDGTLVCFAAFARWQCGYSRRNP